MNPQVVGVAIDCPTAVNLLNGLVSHPHHHYIDAVPKLTGGPFDELAVRITGHRQVTDVTLFHVARAHSLKLVTFDRTVATICPWSENLKNLNW